MSHITTTTAKELTQRHVAAIRHGARSPVITKHTAARVRGKFLRQLGLRPEDLDAVGLAYLDLYCASKARVELMSAHAERHPFIDGDGKPAGYASIYFKAIGGARAALDRFVAHMSERARRSEDASMILRMASTANGDRRTLQPPEGTAS